LVALLQIFSLLLDCVEIRGVQDMSRRKLRTPSYISFKLCTYITFVVRRTCILLGFYSTGLRIFWALLNKKGEQGIVWKLDFFQTFDDRSSCVFNRIFCKTDPIVMNETFYWYCKLRILENGLSCTVSTTVY
jgi:hypothetical protein